MLSICSDIKNCNYGEVSPIQLGSHPLPTPKQGVCHPWELPASRLPLKEDSFCTLATLFLGRQDGHKQDVLVLKRESLKFWANRFLNELLLLMILVVNEKVRRLYRHRSRGTPPSSTHVIMYSTREAKELYVSLSTYSS